MSSDPVSPTRNLPEQSAHRLHAVESRPDVAIPELYGRPLFWMMGVSFLVVVPFFFMGNPSGHDFEFHMNSWMEVVNQWKQGILFPRWAALSHWGYGEARFLFYPPFSWNLGAALGAILPWAAVSGVYIWMALTAAGCSMFLLARRWFSRSDAMLAAILYTANPYHLVIVYWRSALAELLASCLLPVLLLCMLEMLERPRRSVPLLAVIVAAAWLTNAPSAVMVTYSIALFAIMLAILRRRPAVLALAVLALAIGVLLSSFYLLPAAHEQTWVNLSEVFSPGVRPQDNFLFTILKDADHNRFNWLVSIVAVTEMMAVAGALVLSSKFRRSQGSGWWSVALWAVMASILMLPFTGILWEHLPKLRFVQLPWRWLLCLNVAFAVLLTAGFRRWQRLAIYGALLLALAILWVKVQPPWWDSAGDIAEMHDAIRDQSGYEGTDEYVPAGVDPYEIKKDAPQVRLEDSAGNDRVQIDQWAAESKKFTVQAKSDVQARLRLFNYPAWKITVDGSPIAAQTAETTGEIVVPLSAGTHQVSVVFIRTNDRLVGAIISIVMSLLLVADFVSSARSERRPI